MNCKCKCTICSHNWSHYWIDGKHSFKCHLKIPLGNKRKFYKVLRKSGFCTACYRSHVEKTRCECRKIKQFNPKKIKRVARECFKHDTIIYLLMQYILFNSEKTFAIMCCVNKKCNNIGKIIKNSVDSDVDKYKYLNCVSWHDIPKWTWYNRLMNEASGLPK